jgi:hypothetical protein
MILTPIYEDDDDDDDDDQTTKMASWAPHETTLVLMPGK